MDNIFANLNHRCLVYINDILVFSKTIKPHKDDVLAVTRIYIDHDIILDKNKCIYTEQEIKFLGPEIKVGKNYPIKVYSRTETFPQKLKIGSN